MGGPGGHMWHPFDCPDVNSGQDLISFFQRSIDAIKRNPAALKIDGVNLSFRLRENPGTPTGFEFVVDRGSMKELDVQGVTADNADQRFVSKDGSPHGMVDASRILLSIFNESLSEILPELEQLKMTEDVGPFGLYFNTEFVLKKINVKEYPFNFIAIHGVKRFVQKGARSRHGVNVEVEQALLDQIREKVQNFANEKDFRVYTKIPANVKKPVLLEDALNEEFTIVYKGFSSDPDEPGELGAGEGSTKPIKVWLQDVMENPINKIVNISEKMKQIYPKMGSRQTPYAKNIYLEVLKGTAVTDIAAGPEDIEAVVDGVVVMHATRILGNAVLDALESDEFGSAREQEGVVVHDPDICGGTPFKFTGDFIVGGLATSFRESKYRTGELIKEFKILKEQEEEEENQETKQYVILIPGGFKPPTGGHYHMINNYDKKSDVRKVFVITGPKAREGITLEQSKQIFDIYGGFSDKVEFITTDDPTPLTTCYELVKNPNFVNQFPNASFSLGAGSKGGDPQRIEQFVTYFAKNNNLTDAEISYYSPAETLEVDGAAASSSRMRKAFREEDWETFKKLLPDPMLYDDVIKVLLNQQGWVNENFLLAVPRSFLVEQKRPSEEDAEEAQKGLEASARKKGFKKGSKRWNKYVYGGKRNIGWKPERELEEELINEQEVDETQLRERIKIMLSNMLARMPELGHVDAPVKTDALRPHIDPIVNVALAQLSKAVDSLAAKGEPVDQDKEAEEIKRGLDAGSAPVAAAPVEEAAGMAGGSVAGGATNPWVNFTGDENDEQKRRSSSRV